MKSSGTYILVLGRQPIIALAELRQWATAKGLDLSPIKIAPDVVTIDLVSTAADLLLDELAGVVKVARVLDSVPVLSAESLQQYVAGVTTFGLSGHGVSIPMKLGIELKRLRQAGGGGKVRFVRAGSGQALSSVQVEKNKLTETGNAELVLVRHKNEFIVARTEAVQDFASWSARDYGRPGRDDKSGMLPPKLARTMVNFLGLKPRGTILDPFCGSGTVLMEASLVGWSSLRGSDISERAISDTERNWQWAHAHCGVRGDLQLTQSDVIDLPQHIAVNSITAIVTEPYLGPPMSRQPRLGQVQKIVAELMPLYTAALETFVTVLRPGGRVVMIMPRWRVKGAPLLSPTVPQELKQLPLTNDAEPLLYERPNQVVSRELILLEKQRD